MGARACGDPPPSASPGHPPSHTHTIHIIERERETQRPHTHCTWLWRGREPSPSRYSPFPHTQQRRRSGFSSLSPLPMVLPTSAERANTHTQTHNHTRTHRLTNAPTHTPLYSVVAKPYILLLSPHQAKAQTQTLLLSPPPHLPFSQCPLAGLLCFPNLLPRLSFLLPLFVVPVYLHSSGHPHYRDSLPLSPHPGR